MWLMGGCLARKLIEMAVENMIARGADEVRLSLPPSPVATLSDILFHPTTLARRSSSKQKQTTPLPSPSTEAWASSAIDDCTGFT